jgi:hypothetical protein
MKRWWARPVPVRKQLGFAHIGHTTEPTAAVTACSPLGSFWQA